MFSFNLDINKYKKKIVIFLVKRLIGKYITNDIDLESIELNMNGFIIRNLEIDTDKFDIFKNFEIEKANIIELEIYIPWSSILTQNSSLTIKNITIKLNWQYHDENIDINEIAKTILYETLDIKKFDNYLEQSVYNDRDYLLGKDNKKDNNEDGVKNLSTVIKSFIDNITIGIEQINIQLYFPCLNQTIELQLFDIQINNIEESEHDILTSINKTINIEEIVLLCNKRTVITVQQFNNNIWSRCNDDVNFNKLYIYGIKSNIKLIYIYGDKSIIDSFGTIWKDIKQCFKSNNDSTTAKSHQIDWSLSIETWKFILELNQQSHLCSLSKGIYMDYHNKPMWGVSKINSIDNINKSKDFNFFPLEDSMTPKQETIKLSQHSTITQQINTYTISISTWEIYESYDDEPHNIIKKIHSDKPIISVSFDGGLFDKILISISPFLITIDLTLINKYMPLFEVLNNIESTYQQSIFKKKNIIHISAEVINAIIKVPISKEIKMKTDTKNNSYYEESLFLDIYDINVDLKSKVTSITCNKILGNLLNKNNIINFFSAKAPRKEKPIVLQIFDTEQYSNNNTLPEWFHIINATLGKHNVEVSTNVKNIDELNKNILKHSKTIIKLNMRHTNLYLNEHYDVIDNLINKFLSWQSPFTPTESIYMLSNIRLETLSIYISTINFQYTIFNDMINILSAINFYTNHKFNYFQLKNLYLYNNKTRKILLKKLDQPEKHFLRFGVQTILSTPTFKEITISVEFSKSKLMINHEEIFGNDKSVSFWLFDLISFFSKDSTTETPVTTKTKFYVNIEKLTVFYRLLNIPTKLLFDMRNVSIYNAILSNELEPLYSISSEYFDISLIVGSSNITIIQNKLFNLIWKNKQIELTNDICLIEMAADTFYIVKGMIYEFQKQNEQKLPAYDTEICEDYSVNLKDIEEMVNEAIKPISNINSKINSENEYGHSVSAFSIYALNTRKSLSESYDKLNSIIYNSFGDDNKCFICKDINIEIRLYSGLDLVNRICQNYMDITLNKINFIWFDTNDKLHQRLFSTIRSIEINLNQRKHTVIFKPNLNYAFKSWNLISETDMGLLNHIYSLNGEYDTKATHFLNWSNQIGCVIQRDINNGRIEYDYIINTQPIHLNLDQESINFLVNYMKFNDKNLNKYISLDADFIHIKPDEPTIISASNIFIKSFQINPIKFIINYKSSIFDLSWNKNSTILNFVNLDETELHLKQFNYTCTNYIDYTDLFNEIEKHYLEQIINNNSLNILSSLSPIRTMVQLGTGLVNLVIIPSREGIKNSNWKYGIKKGFQNFKSSTLSELVNIGYKLVNTADKLVNNNEETITVSMPTSEYNVHNISNVILNLTKNSIRNSKNTMLELKKDLSSCKKSEQKQLEYQYLED